MIWKSLKVVKFAVKTLRFHCAHARSTYYQSSSIRYDECESIYVPFLLFCFLYSDSGCWHGWLLKKKKKMHDGEPKIEWRSDSLLSTFLKLSKAHSTFVLNDLSQRFISRPIQNYYLVFMITFCLRSRTSD